MYRIRIMSEGNTFTEKTFFGKCDTEALAISACVHETDT
jgi:hypothetical protein